MEDNKQEFEYLTNNLSEDHLVVKSRALVEMLAPTYTLGELKIIDTYLSRINAKDPQTKLIRFTKHEYENLMGLKQVKPSQLERNTKALLSKVVTLKYGDEGYDQYTLFTHARCRQDKETLEWIIELGCNERIEHVFFNLKSAGYLRYQLKNVIHLNSRYSLLLYIYLKSNAYRHEFEIDLKAFRTKLDALQKSYDSFKEFNRRVLEPAIAEINAKTDIFVTFQRKLKRRLTVGLIFTVEPKPTLAPLPENHKVPTIKDVPSEVEGQLSFDETEKKAKAEQIEFFRSALDKEEGNKLIDARIESIIQAALQSEFAGKLHVATFGERDLALYKYIEEQDRYVRAHAPYDSYYGYMIDSIKNNYAKYGI